MNGYKPQMPGAFKEISPTLPGTVPGATPPYMPQQTPDIFQDPEALGALLGTYGDQMEMSDYEKQMARVQALRDQLPDAEGRNAGRVFVAANPLETLGRGIGQYGAMKREKDLQNKIGTVRERIGKNVGEYGKRVLGEE